MTRFFCLIFRYFVVFKLLRKLKSKSFWKLYNCFYNLSILSFLERELNLDWIGVFLGKIIGLALKSSRYLRKLSRRKQSTQTSVATVSRLFDKAAKGQKLAILERTYRVAEIRWNVNNQICKCLQLNLNILISRNRLSKILRRL